MHNVNNTFSMCGILCCNLKIKRDAIVTIPFRKVVLIAQLWKLTSDNSKHDSHYSISSDFDLIRKFCNEKLKKSQQKMFNNHIKLSFCFNISLSYINCNGIRLSASSWKIYCLWVIYCKCVMEWCSGVSGLWRARSLV